MKNTKTTPVAYSLILLNSIMIEREASMSSFYVYLLVIMVVLSVSENVLAADFCVTNDAELSTALSTAASNQESDIIRVSSGTYGGGFLYLPTSSDSLEITGGYDVQCQSLTENPSITILDGNTSQTVLVISSLYSLNLNISNISIANGYLDEYYGAGLYVSSNGGQAVIEDSRFENNVVLAGSGGGANIKGFDSVLLLNSSFYSNSASSGKLASGPSIVGRGSAVVIYAGIEAEVRGCYFENNSGTGTVVEGAQNLVSNTFVSNSSPASLVSSLNIVGNIFERNAASGIAGGANYSQTLNVSANTFLENNSTTSLVVLSSYDSSTITVYNNVFSGNVIGGGSTVNLTLYEQSSASVSNNTFYNNSATGMSGGIAVTSHSNDASLAAINNLFWLNSGNYVNDIYIDNDYYPDYIPSPVNVTSNAFDQSSLGYYITLAPTIFELNYAIEDPKFTSTSTSDLSLLDGSPYIDSGSYVAALTEDINGSPRYINCYSDIGAIESSQGELAVLDTDSDGFDNTCDTDDDGDGVLDNDDAFPLDATESLDTDGDLIGNNADTDDDGDGVLDNDDAFPLDPTESLDTDRDLIGNNADTDDDGDGVLDNDDAFPLDPTESLDTDRDLIGNNSDTDDDGDGVLDNDDAFPLDSSKSTTEAAGGGGGSMGIVWLVILFAALLRKRAIYLYMMPYFSHGYFGQCEKQSSKLNTLMTSATHS